MCAYLTKHRPLRPRRLLNAISLFVLTSCPLAPSIALAESLQEAMASAYAVNPALKAERSRYQAVNQGVWTARSDFLPTVTGDFVGEHNAFDSSRDGTSDRSAFYSMGITVTQPLFQGFSAVNRLNQAHERAASGRNQLLDAEQTLLFNTADAYLRVVRDRAILYHLRSYVGVVQQEVTAARARYRSGDATKTDVEQARARISEAEGNRDQAEGDLEGSKALYARLTGHEPGKIGWPTIPGHLNPANIDEAISIAMKQNPAIRAAISDARAARFAARAAVGDMLPNVQLESSWRNGYRGNLGNRDQEDFRFGLRVTAPIFSGGRNVSAVRTARYTATQEQYELDDIQQTIRENIIRAYKQERAARSRAEAAQRAIRSNKAAADGLNVEYDGGQRSLLDVLDGQRELINSKVSHERARYDATITKLFLLATMGRLDPGYFDIIAERPREMPRLIAELNNWVLRLDPTEMEIAHAELPVGPESVAMPHLPAIK
ncbi:TolC family outer membrane protein [Roseibium sp. CAU 1637]|uniref:TolC family outer membrane protein n=1 Tax=Roseibium limicola TaxID=2816037 RepID=A0A939JAX0_9HYPH|nr:TolC family outer membrane protein [Roseibium limicola]